jgi:putative ABC transport system permease protein
MKIKDCIVIALHTLAGNKMRSALTMLGVLIGVAAVISVVTLGKIDRQMQQEQFAALGANLIYVLPGAPSAMMGLGGPMGSAQTLTLEDAKAIADPANAPAISLVAPAIQTSAQAAAGGKNMGVRVAGVTPEYQPVNNFELAQGRFITNGDYQGRARVVVLGSHISEELFGLMSPLGQTLRLNGQQFRVVGVLKTKGGAFGVEDLMVFAPLSTVQSTLFAEQAGSLGHTIHMICIQAKSKAEIESAKEEITNILRQRHHIGPNDDDDFTVMSMDAIARIADQLEMIVLLILGAIAGVSLLVGSIGIMNIMLVSVVERTREIGLRKALGARRSDILIQFLTESAMLSLCGGVAGILLGWVIIKVVSVIAVNAGLPTFIAMLPLDVVALAVGVSLLVGIISGIYPAFRAARLDPIEALRHE